MNPQITINKKNGIVTFNSEFENRFTKSISRIDDFIVIRFDKKGRKVSKNEKFSNAKP